MRRDAIRKETERFKNQKNMRILEDLIKKEQREKEEIERG